jgi:hypothetical protein
MLAEVVIVRRSGSSPEEIFAMDFPTIRATQLAAPRTGSMARQVSVR